MYRQRYGLSDGATVPAKAVEKPNIVVITASTLEYLDHQRVAILGNQSFNQSIIQPINQLINNSNRTSE